MGPESSPSSMRIVVTPVRASPAATAAWMGEAPRQRGQQRGVEVDAAVAGQVEQGAREDLAEGHHHRDVGGEGRDLLQEGGMADALGLRHREAPLARPGRHRRVLCRWPRPAGRAGWATTRTGARPAATRAASVGTAKSGVPKKRIRSIPGMSAKDSTGPEIPTPHPEMGRFAGRPAEAVLEDLPSRRRC